MSLEEPIKWLQEDLYPGCFLANIIMRDERDQLEGPATLRIQPRPSYCDRGDWILFIYVEGQAKEFIDGADGFPRMFFGEIEEAKEQFNRWANKRRQFIRNGYVKVG